MEPPKTDEEKIEKLLDFFTRRLLLKKYRTEPNENGECDASDQPEAVSVCTAAYKTMLSNVMRENREADGRPLNATKWAEACNTFSVTWITVSHWVCPKKFREAATDAFGTTWKEINSVPIEYCSPPVDLKWYKTPPGSAARAKKCHLCGVLCNSAAQLKAHTTGKLHKLVGSSFGVQTASSVDKEDHRSKQILQGILNGFSLQDILAVRSLSNEIRALGPLLEEIEKVEILVVAILDNVEVAEEAPQLVTNLCKFSLCFSDVLHVEIYSRVSDGGRLTPPLLSFVTSLHQMSVISPSHLLRASHTISTLTPPNYDLTRQFLMLLENCSLTPFRTGFVSSLSRLVNRNKWQDLTILVEAL